MSRRVPALAVMVFLATANVAMAQAWFDAYQRGTAAAHKRDWPVVAEQMAKAIAEKPKEESLARAKRQSVLYVPHFWLGIARIQTGDRAGGQRELRLSESQNVIQKTTHYAELRAALSSFAATDGKGSESDREAAKKAAEKELSVAMTAQVKATGSGATRTEAFRRASQKLQDGFAKKKTGDYVAAAKSAQEASQLFAESITSVRRSTARVGFATSPPVVSVPGAAAPDQRTAEAAPVSVAPPQSLPAAPVEEPRSRPSTQRATDMLGRFNELLQSGKRRYAGRELEAFHRSSRSAVQEWQQKLETAGNAGEVAIVEASIQDRTVELRALYGRLSKTIQPDPAVSKKIGDGGNLLLQTYLAFSRGELEVAEELAGALILTKGKQLEGYMLRACTRYTRSQLRNGRDLEAAAASDFRAALKISRSARLDPKYFSPKVVAFLEKQR